MLPDNLRLGYPHGIDEQHDRLFAICARLRELTVDRLNPGRVGDIGTASGIQRAIRDNLVPPAIDANTLAACADVVRYSLEHFQWEEAVLSRVDDVIETSYPDRYEAFSAHYRAHLSEHLSLTQSTMIYKGQFEEHTVSALSLYVFVRHWLIGHVNKLDREFAGWCRVADGLPDPP